MIKKYFKIDINSFGRDFGEHKKLMYDIDSSIWKTASTELKSRSFRIDSTNVTIEIDFSRAVEYTDYWYNIFSTQSGLDRLINNPGSIKCIPVFFEAIVTIHDSHTDYFAYRNIIINYLKYFLHEIFLLTNLSSPGSSNFSSTTISSPSEINTQSISLSCYIFEQSWHKSLDKKWPTVTHLPLDIVTRWYNSLEIGTSQVGRNKLQKALFAILHIAKQDSFEPGSLIWLSHALEALYDVPPALSYNYLERRMLEFLQAPKKKETSLGKNIRLFYDEKNAFAHGAMEVIHPMGSVLSDNSLNDIEKYEKKLVTAFDFASLLLIATLQEFIARGWKDIVFKDRYFGVTI